MDGGMAHGSHIFARPRLGFLRLMAAPTPFLPSTPLELSNLKARGRTLLPTLISRLLQGGQEEMHRSRAVSD